jgi:hypothetical protein
VQHGRNGRETANAPGFILASDRADKAGDIHALQLAQELLVLFQRIRDGALMGHEGVSVARPDVIQVRARDETDRLPGFSAEALDGPAKLVKQTPLFRKRLGAREEVVVERAQDGNYRERVVSGKDVLEENHLEFDNVFRGVENFFRSRVTSKPYRKRIQEIPIRPDRPQGRLEIQAGCGKPGFYARMTRSQYHVDVRRLSFGKSVVRLREADSARTDVDVRRYQTHRPPGVRAVLGESRSVVLLKKGSQVLLQDGRVRTVTRACMRSGPERQLSVRRHLARVRGPETFSFQEAGIMEHRHNGFYLVLKYEPPGLPRQLGLHVAQRMAPVHQGNHRQSLLFKADHVVGEL